MGGGGFQSTTGVSTRDLTIYGDYFITSKIDSIQNKFWKDVLLSWVTIQQNQKLLTTEDIQGQNIWYNSKILKDRNLFCIVIIYDLLDNEGNILTFETFRNKYQIKTNFLHYASLVNAIKSLLPSMVNINKTPTHIQTPVLPFKMKIILITNKGSRDIYNVLNSKKLIPKSQKKYADKGLKVDSYIWEKYYILLFKCLKDTTIIWFQYRLIH